MIKVADLEARIRELAGEVEILRIRETGLKDDLALLKKELDDSLAKPGPKTAVKSG